MSGSEAGNVSGPVSGATSAIRGLAALANKIVGNRFVGNKSVGQFAVGCRPASGPAT